MENITELVSLKDVTEFVSKEVIVNLFINNRLINTFSSFACYTDSIFTYHCKVPKTNTFFQISIISDGEFLSKERVSDLLTRKGIKFLDVTYFVPENGHHVGVEKLTYRKNKK